MEEQTFFDEQEKQRSEMAKASRPIFWGIALIVAGIILTSVSDSIWYGVIIVGVEEIIRGFILRGRIGQNARS